MIRHVTLLLLIAFPVAADELPANECERWQKGRSRPVTIEVNDFTLQRAESALAEITSSSLDSNMTFRERRRLFDEQSKYVQGYLLRMELLAARTNREHDADEFGSFCRHWSLVNFGSPDYVRTD